MTETNQESNSTLGNGGQANPPASQSANVQPTSTFDAEALLKSLEPLIEKKVQSVKDRRFDDIDKRLGGAEAIMERVKSLIPEDKFNELKKELEFEELKRRVYGEAPTGAPKPSGTQPSGAALQTAREIVSKLGLQESEPDVALLIAKHESDPVQLAIELTKHSNKPRPAPTPASVSPQPGQPSEPASQDALRKNYIADMKSAKGNRSQLVKLAEEYRAKGFDTGSVDLARELIP